MFNKRLRTPADVDQLIKSTAALSRIEQGTRLASYEELETFCLTVQNVNNTLLKTVHSYFYCIVGLLGFDFGLLLVAVWLLWLHFSV